MIYDYLIEIRPIIEKLLLKRKMVALKEEMGFRKIPVVLSARRFYSSLL